MVFFFEMKDIQLRRRNLILSTKLLNVTSFALHASFHFFHTVERDFFGGDVDKEIEKPFDLFEASTRTGGKSLSNYDCSAHR